MAEVKVVTREAGAISFNYEELKGEIMAKAAEYSAAVYTEENIGFAKADRAKLNKLKTALNDERLKREREFMQPFMEFKAQVADLISIIDEPIKAIDTQVKAFEENQRLNKKGDCVEIFASIPHPEWLDYMQIENPKWYNKTVTLATVKDEMEGAIQKVKSECEMIQNYCPNPDAALALYRQNLDLKAAMELGKAITLQQKPIPHSEIDDTPEEASWVCFKALITPTQAKALASFMKTNKIKFEKGE